ncbi:MAG TPA: acetyl-CoA carboxylase biotin carboxyl carrier protein [Blastocatellia bacterium]
MDWKQLKELIEIVSEKGFTEFEVEREGFRLRISNAVVSNSATPARSTSAFSAGGSAVEPGLPNDFQAAESGVGPVPARQSTVPPARAPEPGSGLHVIKSPIVGTFYRASSPNSSPFVKVGDRVSPDSVVCIIEAMKLMNEIQAEIAGEITEIYVADAQPVEYDQPLFAVNLK